MCRRCGERDKRGSARNRRRRKEWLLAEYGDGHTVTCSMCPAVLTYLTVESDRIVPGGPYARHNIRPACGPCNRSRSNVPAGCDFG